MVQKNQFVKNLRTPGVFEVVFTVVLWQRRPIARSNFMRLSKKGSCSEQSYLLGLLAFQELSVSSDLLLQSSLDIHEDLVFAVLALHISSELSQLRLDAANQALDLRQLGTVTPFRVCQGAFQRGFLRAERLEGKPRECYCQLQDSAQGGECVPISVHILTYHVELGLKFYFQPLECASQVGDF